MRRSLVIASAVAGCAVMVIGAAGCASSDVVGAGAGVAAPDLPVSTTAIGAIPPSGPAATAATGSPPPLADHAVATVSGVTVACPDDAPFGDPSNGAGGDRGLGKHTQIAAVVRCETVQRAYPGLGEWTVQLAEVADSGLEPFLAELRKPSAPLTSGACADFLRLIDWFALVEAGAGAGPDDAVIRPPVPKDECGQVSEQAVAALAALDFRLADAVRVRQTRTPASTESGCAQSWKDMVAFVARPGRLPDVAGKGSGVAQPASPPPSVLVCLYRAGPLDGDLRAGDLIKGVTVTGDAAAQLAGATQVVRDLPHGCADADEFAVVHVGGQVSYVELGGCDRLYTADGLLGAASHELVSGLAAALG